MEAGGCLFCTFVDMRGQRPLLQGVAQLGAKKTARGVAGDAQVKAIHEAAHHGRVFVDDVGVDFEVVVINDGVDLSTQRSQPVFDDPANLVHVLAVVNTMPFEIGEEPVLTRVVGESLLNLAAAGRANPWGRWQKCADPSVSDCERSAEIPSETEYRARRRFRARPRRVQGLQAST